MSSSLEYLPLFTFVLTLTYRRERENKKKKKTHQQQKECWMLEKDGLPAVRHRVTKRAPGSL